MKYIYYPGCSVQHTGRMYDRSFKAAWKALGYDVIELEDWNCCGATAYMSIRELTSHALAARNLALAEAEGADVLMTGCPACYLVLGKTNDYFKQDRDFAAKIRTALQAADLDYRGTVEVRHILDVLVNDIGLETVREKMTRSLEGLKVASYYGCQLTRPYGRFDDTEDPVLLDRFVEAIGATRVPYPLKTKCCGGMVANTDSERILPLLKELISCAHDGNADCIMVACPLCHMNLDFYQSDVNKRYGTDFHMPVVYFTQLLGLALGISARELEIGLELVPADKVLAKYA